MNMRREEGEQSNPPNVVSHQAIISSKIFLFLFSFFPHPIFIIQLITFFSCHAMRETSTFSDGRLADCTPTLPLKATRKYMEKVFESSRDLPKKQGLEGPRPQREGKADSWCHFSP